MEKPTTNLSPSLRKTQIKEMHVNMQRVFTSHMICYFCVCVCVCVSLGCGIATISRAILFIASVHPGDDLWTLAQDILAMSMNMFTEEGAIRSCLSDLQSVVGHKQSFRLMFILGSKLNPTLQYLKGFCADCNGESEAEEL